MLRFFLQCATKFKIVILIFFLFLLTISCQSRPDKTKKLSADKTTTTTHLRFVDVTGDAGLSAFRHVNGAAGKKWFPEAMGSGGGFIDYNGDGWEDIILVGGGTWETGKKAHKHALWLYRNNKDGTFTETTNEAGLGNLSAYGLGVTAADYDNDGDQDLFFTTLFRNLFFRNDDGVFTEIGKDIGLGDRSEWSTSAMFFDADGDSWLDLYVGSYVAWTPETDIWCSTDGVTKGYCTPLLYTGIPGRYYHNNGDGTFSDLTDQCGFADSPGKTLGIAAFDFNRDAHTDLVVSNDTKPDLLYQSNGDGTFKEIGTLSGIAYDENGRARAGMGIDAGVIDQTGEETIVVGNFSKEMIGVYRHTGHGLFADRAALSKIGRSTLMTLTFGLFLADFDLDGDLDLFTANGHVHELIEVTMDGVKYREPPHLFLNNGNGIFKDIAPQLGEIFRAPILGRSTSYADFDHDGDVDILITENSGPAHLWRNEISGMNYVRVKIIGETINQDGLGTRIVLYSDGKFQERFIRTGSSFMANSEKIATFGLGRTSAADSLIVIWPGGKRNHFSHLPANRFYQINESSGILQLK